MFFYKKEGDGRAVPSPLFNIGYVWDLWIYFFGIMIKV